MERINFVVHLAALPKLVVVFSFMQSTALDTSYFLNPIQKSSIAPLLTVFILGHTQVHIYTSNSGNVVSYIKALINKAFSLTSTINVPNVYSNNRHVKFR